MEGALAERLTGVLRREARTELVRVHACLCFDTPWRDETRHVLDLTQANRHEGENTKIERAFQVDVTSTWIVIALDSPRRAKARCDASMTETKSAPSGWRSR